MIRDFLIEFKDGLFDSIQGFLVLRKLDKPPKNAAETTEPRASSVEPHTSNSTSVHMISLKLGCRADSPRKETNAKEETRQEINPVFFASSE